MPGFDPFAFHTMKFSSQISDSRISHSLRNRFNPIRHLSPETLSHILDSFAAGYLKPAALAWEAIEHRDDVIQGVAAKRKKSVARLPWEILTIDPSPEAMKQKEALEYFYNNLRATHACDRHQSGGLALLVKQMMDSVGKKYAIHEIVYQTPTQNSFGDFLLSAEFRFVPLWFFENRHGRMQFLPQEGSLEGIELEAGSWMVTHGDGLMEACSIAYLFKHLPLRDWLVYCERNGMPGVKGITNAQPGSEEWESAKAAIESFGAEFNALMTTGTQIEAIDLTSRGELPYPSLVDRMDRAISALWRGSDLSTLSRATGAGASLQGDECILLEEDDACTISETLNQQVDIHVLRYLFGDMPVKAYIKLIPKTRRNLQEEIRIYRELYDMGLPLAVEKIRENFGIPTPQANENILSKQEPTT
jgi:phage gp29-like protein